MKQLRTFIQSVQFKRIINVTLAVNFVVLAAKRHQESDTWEQMQKVGGLLVTAIFVWESVIQLCAWGVCNYLLNTSNFLDFFLTMVAVVDSYFMTNHERCFIERVLHAVRVLRVIRLTQNIPGARVSQVGAWISGSGSGGGGGGGNAILWRVVTNQNARPNTSSSFT